MTIEDLAEARRKAFEILAIPTPMSRAHLDDHEDVHRLIEVLARGPFRNDPAFVELARAVARRYRKVTPEIDLVPNKDMRWDAYRGSDALVYPATLAYYDSEPGTKLWGLSRTERSAAMFAAGWTHFAVIGK